VSRKGDALTSSELAGICPDIGHDRGGGTGHVRAPQSVVSGMRDCVARIAATYHEVVTYQPADRNWPLQWYELGLFLAAALLLAAACAWRVGKIG
jgi:hypothetical protein